MTLQENTPALSIFDVQRLEPLLMRQQSGDDHPEHLEFLLGKIYSCKEIPPVAVPPYLVTMNSTVLLRDASSGKESTITLVFPLQADASEGRISVLAPLGAALFGSKVGEVVQVQTPLSLRRYIVKDILFQPEAAGRYDL